MLSDLPEEANRVQDEAAIKINGMEVRLDTAKPDPNEEMQDTKQQDQYYYDVNVDYGYETGGKNGNDANYDYGQEYNYNEYGAQQDVAPSF